MRRRHFQATGTETDLYVAILDNRDHTTDPRHDDVLAFEPLVLLLFGVDTNGNIAEDGLRTGGSDNAVIALFILMYSLSLGEGRGEVFFHYSVFQIIELVMLVVVDHLLIGEGCLTLGVPVHHTQTAVDEPFLI